MLGAGNMVKKREGEAVTGCVGRLWCHPVKSMLGQAVPALTVEYGGVAGDRRYAVRSADGRANSGKPMAGYGRIQGLLGFAAGYADNRGVEIRFPNGNRYTLQDPALEWDLSATLGQPVTLREEEQGSGPYVDDSPVHLLTTASLAWLRNTLPGAAVDERRFRPNIVVDWSGREPVEQDWIGSRLHLGEVELRITEPTVRCGMVAMAHAELPHDPSVLRHITQQADLNFGVYAEVIKPGRVAIGDAARLLDTSDSA